MTKRKSIIAKGIILAMILSLVIPTPVLAASKGGKLIKSATYYNYNLGRWEKSMKENYTYGKKPYPKEIKRVDYSESQRFMGVAYNASVDAFKVKYKFKGKTPKSMTLKNASGKVSEKNKYKKGRLVKKTWTKNSSHRYADIDMDGNETAIYEDVDRGSYSESVAYNKKGLATSKTYTSAETKTDAKNPTTNSSENIVENYTYAVTHKKGVPSYILATKGSTETGSNSFGTYSYVNNADGTYVDTYSDGTTATGKYSYIWKDYTKFNKKGLAIESGQIRVDTATGAQAVKPEKKVVYKSKKGRVTQATVYTLVTKYDSATSTWTVAKEKPSTMVKFKYNKTKIGNVRYLSMINAEVGAHKAFFSWY